MTQALTDVEYLKRCLQANVAHSRVAETEKLVLEFGAPYVGIKRPRGFRLGPKKHCFGNAAEALISADDECSRSVTYVEGYAMCPNLPPFQHAWLALDDRDAVELTIRRAPREMAFFGVSFSRVELFKMLEEEMTYGVFRYPPRAGLRDLLKRRTPGRGLSNSRIPEASD